MLFDDNAVGEGIGRFRQSFQLDLTYPVVQLGAANLVHMNGNKVFDE